MEICLLRMRRKSHGKVCKEISDNWPLLRRKPVEIQIIATNLFSVQIAIRKNFFQKKLRKVSTPSKQWNLPHEPSCRWSIHSVVPSVPTDRSKIKDTTTYAHFPQHYNESGICGDLRAIRHSSWRFYNLFQWYFDYFWRQHYSNHKHTKCDK